MYYTSYNSKSITVKAYLVTYMPVLLYTNTLDTIDLAVTST